MGLTNSIAQNLRKPSNSLTGFLIKKALKKRNALLEHNAVRLCRLEPHHHVLEVGFGPGIGLKAATETVVDGKVYGLDFSPSMVEEVTKSLQSEIASGRLQVDLGDVASLPYSDITMDRIFHCNCYYFWSPPATVAGELHRVLKPGGFMVTTLRIDALRRNARRGFLDGANWQPEPYMDVLRSVGFMDVSMEDLQDPMKGNTSYQVILAYKK